MLILIRARWVRGHTVRTKIDKKVRSGAFWAFQSMLLSTLVRKKFRKRRLFKKVQAFCEEKVLRYLLGVFWYAESKNQCWQAEKWRLHYLICIFPRWPPNWRKIHKNMKSNVLRMQNWFKSIQKHLLLIGGSSLTSIYAIRIKNMTKR